MSLSQALSPGIVTSSAHCTLGESVGHRTLPDMPLQTSFFNERGDLSRKFFGSDLGRGPIGVEK
jgi:hypothetical protein